MSKLQAIESTPAGVAASRSAASTARLVENVVLALLNGFRRENAIEFVTAGVFVSPGANGFEHIALDLDAVVAQGGVVESAQDIVHDLVDGDVGVVPSKQDATMYVSNVRNIGIRVKPTG